LHPYFLGYATGHGALMDRPILNMKLDDDARRAKQKDARVFFRRAPSPGSLPLRTSNRVWTYKPLLDQGSGAVGTGSCGGGGTANLLFIAANAAGTPLPWCPSPADIYRCTREIERALMVPAGEPLPALTDSGVYPTDVFTALNTYGIRPMQGPSPLGLNYDIDSSNVNYEEGLLELRQDALHVVTGAYRINEKLPLASVVGQMKQALAFGSRGLPCPIGFGGFVDTAVMEYQAGDSPLDKVNLDDPSGGGHWWTIRDYDTDSAGNILFDCLSSWGDFGDDGGFWVTQNWIAQQFGRGADIFPAPVTIQGITS
jgi:hypothetical protein